MEMKIKLPRKRKKAYIKEKGKPEYLGMRLCNEILYEEKPIKKHTRFPNYKVIDNKIVILFNW